MNKYYNMKTPPRFNGEWKYKVFYAIDIIVVLAMLFTAKMFNNLFGLPYLFSFFNYIFAFIIAIILIWRPAKSPDSRQFFVLIEAIFFSDTNHYHALDPNRKYHKK